MAELALQNFFVRRGMPRMVVVDADGLFAGVFRAMCEALLIPCEAVARENHKANTCEQFHRLLNKVQRINTSDTGTQLSLLPVMPGTLPQSMERTFPDVSSPSEEISHSRLTTSIMQQRARSAQARHSKPLSFSTRASHSCKNNANFSTC